MLVCLISLTQQRKLINASSYPTQLLWQQVAFRLNVTHYKHMFATTRKRTWTEHIRSRYDTVC